MFKRILIFLFTFSTIVINAQITKGKIHYKISSTPIQQKKIDSILQKKDQPVLAKKMLKDILKNNEDVEAVLGFSNTESLYEVTKKLKNDGKSVLNITRFLAGNNNLYYTNSTTKEYLKQIKTGDVLRVEMKPLDWKITQETKTIGKYVCYKATTTREIENSRGKFSKKIVAWFTPIIPVNFGPEIYFGLPGLILEIIEDKKSIKATKITLNTTEKITIKRPTKGAKITQEEYHKMSRNFFKNLDRKRN